MAGLRLEETFTIHRIRLRFNLEVGVSTHRANVCQQM